MKGPLPILRIAYVWHPPINQTISSSTSMPIAPITGKLRKRLLVDLSTALGFGIAAGYAYWYVLLIF
jgi:hypothetical protein